MCGEGSFPDNHAGASLMPLWLVLPGHSLVRLVLPLQGDLMGWGKTPEHTVVCGSRLEIGQCGWSPGWARPVDRSESQSWEGARAGSRHVEVTAVEVQHEATRASNAKEMRVEVRTSEDSYTQEDQKGMSGGSREVKEKDSTNPERRETRMTRG